MSSCRTTNRTAGYIQPDCYLQNHGRASEDQDDLIRKPNKSDHEARKAKFTLPMEPTESLDKTKEYPPIVTADGSVDTDIDHLMENPEDDYDDLPIQDIPSKFPKPHVIRVIDGSLDDDIDNLMNHDGTMAHTLVDAPKNFNRRDLKEINSKKPGKKNNIQSSRYKSLNKMNSERSDEENIVDSAEIVPYCEKNNSSNEILQAITTDFETLNDIPNELTSPPPRVEEEDCWLSPDSVKNYPEHGEFFEQKNSSDKLCEFGQATENSATVIPEDLIHNSEDQLKTPVEIPEEDVAPSGENSETTGIYESENPDQPDQPDTQTDLVNRISNEKLLESNPEDIPQLVQQLLSRISVEELKKHLDIENNTESINASEDNSKEDKSREVTDSIVNENNPRVTAESQAGTDVEDKSDIEQSLNRQDITAVKPPTENESSVVMETSMQHTITLLKKTLDNVMNDMGSGSQTESQRALAVTALKVAGDSMNAAAKMADALTLLVKTSHPNLVAGNLGQGQQSWGQNPNSCSGSATIKQDTAEASCASLCDPSIIKSEVVKKDKPESSSKQKSDENDEFRKSNDVNSYNEDDDFRCQVNNDSALNKARKESENKNKLKSDVSEDEYDRPEKKSRDRRESSRYRKYDDYSPLNKDDIEKSHERKRSEARKGESKEERVKRSSRKHENDYDEENVEESPRMHRKKGKEKGRKPESEIKKKLKKTEEDNGYERQDSWGRYESRERTSKEDRRESMKRPEKQYDAGYEGVNESDAHHRSKGHREKSRQRSSHRRSYDANESNSPKYSSRHNDFDKICRDDDGEMGPSRRPTLRKEEVETFEKSEPWSLPPDDSMQGERYFNHVVRRLKPFSPSRLPKEHNPQKDYIRAKLVGSGVDPYARDSDFDSIEFNGNARMSLSRVVHFGEGYGFRTDEEE